MSPDADRAGYRQEPSEEEDFDRELDELLGELRVLLPGVAVLFAFLLTIPFSNRFGDIADLDRSVYFLAFVASALALVCLVGETAYHRLGGKPYNKRQLIRTSSHEAVAGLVFLAVALVAVVFLVTDVIFPGPLTGGVTGAVLTLAVFLWFVLPLARRRK